LWGHTDTIKLLLEAGANVNIKTTDDRTALSIAKERGHKELIELLEAAGAKQ
jgi:ankyrin repeat protein